MDKPKPKFKVNVIAKKGRKTFLFRWKDDLGNQREQACPIPIGDSEQTKKRNRGEAERLAIEFVTKLEKQEREARESPAVLIDIWRAWLIGSGTNESSAEANVYKVRIFCEEMQIEQAPDITEDKAVAFLTALRKVPKARGTRLNPITLSASSINHYLVSIRAFCSWLIRRGTLTSNPLAYLKMQVTQTDRRRVRRHIGADDFKKLLDAANSGGTLDDVSGPDRAMIYLTAGWTGLRRKELSRLTMRSLRFNADPPVILLGAEFSKNKLKTSIPIHPDLANRLKDWLATKDVLDLDAPIFQIETESKNLRDTAAWMRHDLAAAGLDYSDHDGFADFHSLRHTFVSNLALAGVHLVEAQRLARHGDPKITAQVYTHISEHQKAAAIGKLPAPPEIRQIDAGDSILKFEAG